VASPSQPLAWTNRLAGGPNSNYRFRLESGAPLNARVNSTNGVFRWTPQCLQGGSRNRVTVWVTDISAEPNLSDATTFTVRVEDCAEPGLGNIAVRPGDTGLVPLTVFSSAPLRQFTTTVQVPAGGRLGELTLQGVSPSLCSTSLTHAGTEYQLRVDACEGNWLQGTQLVGYLRFTVSAAQPSGFLSLRLGESSGTGADGRNITGSGAGKLGRVAVVGQEPLLDATLAGEHQPVVTLYTTAGVGYRMDASVDLTNWIPFVTGVSTGVQTHVDESASSRLSRSFRASRSAATNGLSGDIVFTTAGEVVVHPINHASVVLGWNGRMIYVDPVGGATPYTGLARADLILVTHSHSDHFSATTLAVITNRGATVIAPQAVANSLSGGLRSMTIVLTNGASTTALGLGIEAVPAYNANHPLGTGNGYVLTIGERRFYFSGDTGDIPETRALPRIDVAFLCMNIPFTMNVAQAASVTRAFRPAVIYPYHFRNQDGTFADLNSFTQQVGNDVGVEVRIRKWY